MQGEKLLRELQLLFTHMLLTERRYVDPAALLKFTSHSGVQGECAAKKSPWIFVVFLVSSLCWTFKVSVLQKEIVFSCISFVLVLQGECAAEKSPWIFLDFSCIFFVLDFQGECAAKRNRFFLYVFCVGLAR